MEHALYSYSSEYCRALPLVYNSTAYLVSTRPFTLTLLWYTMLPHSIARRRTTTAPITPPTTDGDTAIAWGFGEAVTATGEVVAMERTVWLGCSRVVWCSMSLISVNGPVVGINFVVFSQTLGW